ncbi:similar to Saccharomyces cerevisiae YBR015C MNN2 Alpha-1,2-mannosyltransferase [Maudiozyma barnettii]|mgnify:CR=1 FL=1|uniref:Similar to Saccharomyces cerevisiae YBR015C MNN2 Alpha-1,2-mannosyltransferase n=1 Tax=Maudiozyma barnettii TaxID=61262 RepID=A0A8H2ZJM2_9SACH|nr:alpha-1,2-mannosyltransferase MNN2 [Kazachstania barnettii]CAB4257183.1 similar to Saccharomyces cerevisiae YBR015C MNN2 Alpha-1,2-mannosyltransferase [Kazachstania barnettii]CAD1779553.1 similar to Saccharomyces cerevisiae YBR015C MNN2 Alpha-1,2-mannosyltransferase [Kazachstania barnettii]
MLVNKRIGKLLKITLVILGVLGVYALIESVRSGNDYSNLSVSQYRDYLKNHIDTLSSSADSDGHNKEEKVKDERLLKFYSSVFQSIIDHSPTGKCRRVYKDSCKLSSDVGNRPDDYKNWFKLSFAELIDCLELDSGEIENLSKSHASFIEQLNKLVLPKDSYKNDGIVTVGGGKFSLMAFLVIRTLRNLGTTLPVEVFIPPNDEGETEFCNKLLPKYNAKCVYISDILPQEMINNFEFKGYQFKSIAIIASSFENLLLLDADNFPIKPLDDIFEAEPYKSTGLVMWPDFWRRTTQPLYYQIAGRTIDFKTRIRNSIDDLTPPHVYTKNLQDLKDVPFHDFLGTIPDVSTESGQLLINKSKHLATVLLALYYNVNGPTWYYPIFSQKAAGEGDKETFIAAANFYDLPFYQVKTNVGVDGYHQPNDKGYRGVAMLQHDFIQDYGKYVKARTDISNKYAKAGLAYDPEYSVESFYKEYFEDGQKQTEVDVMFIHSNLPKFDPYTLWTDEDLIVDGKHIRSFTNLRRLKNYDIELENFKVFKEVLCGVSKVPLFKYLEDKMNANDFKSMCQYIDNRLDFLEESHASAISSD